MECEKDGDEGLQGDKLDVLYGEADSAARARVEVHLEACAACREEMAALRGLRRDLGRWRLPLARPGFTPRGFVVPHWLAAAALVLLAFGATLGASGYLSLRRALARPGGARVAARAPAARVARSDPGLARAHAGLRGRRRRAASLASRPASTSGSSRARRSRPSAWTGSSPSGRSAPRCGGASTWRRWRRASATSTAATASSSPAPTS